MKVPGLERSLHELLLLQNVCTHYNDIFVLHLLSANCVTFSIYLKFSEF